VRFRNQIPVHVALEIFVAAMKALRCPECGASSKKIGFEEARTLAEDAEDRVTGSERARAEHWLRTGETGLSSETIHAAMTGRSFDGSKMQAPADLDDMRRSILLLHHVPEWRNRMHEMGKVSEEWAKLAPRFLEIEAAFFSDAPNLDRGSARAALMLQEARSRN
jgi:hypothetical protein